MRCATSRRQRTINLSAVALVDGTWNGGQHPSSASTSCAGVWTEVRQDTAVASYRSRNSHQQQDVLGRVKHVLHIMAPAVPEDIPRALIGTARVHWAA